jgi:membrane protein
MEFTRQGLIDFGKRLKDEVSEDDVSGAAAELAYRFFLALFPFFIFLAALGGFVASLSGVDSPTDEIMDMVGESLPADSASVLRSQLESIVDEKNAGLLSIGIIGAIWASSSGVGALMKNMNRIYGVGESRKTPIRIAIALGLTVLGAGVMVLAFAVLFVGQLYGREIAGEVGLENTAAFLFSNARWPLAVVMILFAVAFLYWLAPNAEVPLRWISPGAVFFTVTWIIASIGFGFYVANFGSYNETYGTLGGVVVLLIWFYLTSFLLLLGAEINGVLAQQANEMKQEGVPVKPEPVGAQEPLGAFRPLAFAGAGLLWVLALAGVLRRRTA